jgi:transcription elongation factor Elf1
MIIHIFECKKCQRQHKHVTSTATPLALSNKSECATCNKIQTFQFVREGNRKEDWYSNILQQVNRKQKESDQIGDDEADRIAV